MANPQHEEEESKSVVSIASTSLRKSRKSKRPSWFTPKRLLLIFCLINLVNYVDRGAISSNGVNGNLPICRNGKCKPATGIQGHFLLNNFSVGCLSSAFMVGLLVASPIFAALAKSVNPFKLIGVGLSIWTFAVTGCGFSFNFLSILICRMLVGVGEASFISLAAPFIDDNAPAAQKTLWLSTFYMCIPSGYALGYVYGGLVGTTLSWRAAFWGEGILMLPFAILGFVMKPLRMKGFKHDESNEALTVQETAVSEVQDSGALNPKDRAVSMKEDVTNSTIHKPSKPKIATKIKNHLSRFMKDMKDLLVDKVYVVNVLGYVAYNFVIGSYSYWGPKAGYNIYHMTNADMIFGGITIVCGILGTLAGGFLLDFMSNTMSNSFKLLSTATLFGAILCFGAFCLKNMYGFLALFAVGQLLLFATQGPVNFVCLHCVKPSLRPLSMAISTVAIHIFGDVPSSPLVGVVQDHIQNWRSTALILTSVLIPAAAIWFTAIFMDSVDRYDEESDDEESDDEIETTEMPSLEEKKTEKTTESAAQPVTYSTVV
ncbi:probable sphingolipid transporter spinster homolog 2 isoform X3 [Rosa rugosa]|uniref:probable sphingolipid transporter spinster homolog 2 isoform X3 n=1 Tax=Rosa rugosa TaxID=74645 RepID=UPI002B410D73|nr:probable sphingolipid transporter spinster homolog 2 isoform X3 [Rosa rugosa]